MAKKASTPTTKPKRKSKSKITSKPFIVMRKGQNLFSWTGYYATQLVSATIEAAAPTLIVLTFLKTVRPFTNAVFGEFTVTGTAKTINAITLSESGKTATLQVTVAYVNGNTCTLVHNMAAPNKGTTVNTVVTNNIPI